MTRGVERTEPEQVGRRTRQGVLAAPAQADANGDTERKCVLCEVVKPIATFNVVYGQNSGKRWCLSCKQLRMAGYASGYKLPTMMAAMKRFGPHHTRVEFIDLMREVDWENEAVPELPADLKGRIARTAGGKWVPAPKPDSGATPASNLKAEPGLSNKNKVPKAAKRLADLPASGPSPDENAASKKRRQAPASAAAAVAGAARFVPTPLASVAQPEIVDTTASNITVPRAAKAAEAKVQQQRKPKAVTQQGIYAKVYPAKQNRSERRALAAFAINETMPAAVRKLATGDSARKTRSASKSG